jgi:hypothetical protein
MDEFDSELRRAFAALEDPADGGFAAQVSTRVARKERARSVQGWLNVAAFLVAGGAFAYGLFGVLQSMVPAALAALGFGVSEVQSAWMASRDLAGVNVTGLGAALTPLLLAAAVAVGGLVAARAATED